MEKKLQPLKNKLLLFFFFVLSAGVFGQTLVTYNFSNNLAATTPNAQLNPLSLEYFNAANQVSTPLYYTVPFSGNPRLRFRESGDQVILSFNGTEFAGLNVSFNVWSGTAFGQISGDYKIYLKVGTAAEVEIGSENFDHLAFGWTSENLSINIPAADNQSDVQIRIVGNIHSSFGSITGFGIDKLVLSSYAPKIQPYGYNSSNTPSQIETNAVASTAYGTYFGIVNTEDPNAATRTFRITNSGTSSLQISAITFSGDNPGDFTWVTSPATPAPTTPTATNPINSFPATINANASRDFTVRFNPSADGKRSALLNIASNANPSPYSFYVEGRGSTCATTNLALKSNTIEASQPSSDLLTATVVSGNFNHISGNNQAGQHAGVLNGSTLYAQSNTSSPTYNLYTSSDRSWYTRDRTNKVAFGPVDIANENGVYISFNLAAFSRYSSTDFGDADYVELQVLKPGTSGSNDSDWSSELRVEGNDDFSNGNTRYSFDVGTTAETTYDGDGTYSPFQNGNGVDNKYSKIKLNIPGNSGINNLIFRIVAYNNSSEKLWLIDDVAVSSANVIERRWNGTAWTDGNDNSVAAPDEATKSYKNYRTVFNGDYTVPATNLSICECEVSSAANLTVPANSYLSVQTKVINKGDENNVVVASDGNLIQIEDEAVNTGDITAYRTMTPHRNLDNTYSAKEYNFYSSPVFGQIMKAIFGGSTANTAFAIVLNEPGNNFVNANAADYNKPGKGFAVKDPTVAFVGTQTTVPATFKGVPNNGIHDVEVTRAATPTNRGWNLVGNPYPSNIDATLLYNASTNIHHDFRFWDNTVNATYTYNGSYGQYSYAILNASTGVGTPAPGLDPTSTPTPIGTKAPDRYISVGQGFIVRALTPAGGTVKFSNAKRTATKPGNVYFGKNTTPDFDMYRIQLKTTKGIVLTNTIAYNESWSNDFGNDDSRHPGVSSFDLLYNMVGEEKVVINGRSGFTNEDVIPLGYKAYERGTYIIRLIDQVGLFANNGQVIYLKDKQTGITADLSQGEYEFTTEAGEFTNRFEIVYQPQTTLDVTAVNKESVQIYRHGEDFVVKASTRNIKDVELYEMSGKLIFKKSAATREVRINAAHLANGIYMVRAVLDNGEVTIKKVRY